MRFLKRNKNLLRKKEDFRSQDCFHLPNKNPKNKPAKYHRKILQKLQLVQIPAKPSKR